MPNCKYHDPDLCDAHHIKELETLAQIARILSCKAKQEEVLLEVIDALELSDEMRHVTITLLTIDGREVRVGTGKKENVQETEERASRKGEGITGQVLETGRPRIVPLVADEPRLEGRLHSHSLEPRSFICVPAMVDCEIFGTLSTELPAQGLPDLGKRQCFLSIAANLIANDACARRIAHTEQQAGAITGEEQLSLKERVTMLECDLILDSLKRNKGTISAAARELGISERMVRYKIRNLGINYETLFKKKRRRRT